MRPSGAVAVVVPSGWRIMAQPQRWIAIWWWNLHSRIRLPRLVGPPWAQWIRWCTSHTDAGCRQRGELAVLVSEGDGGAQVGRDGAGGAADVQWLAEGVEGGGEQGAAQAGGQPAGAGDQVQAPARDGGLQPLPGGFQAAGDPAVAARAGGGRGWRGGRCRAAGRDRAGAGGVAGAVPRGVAVPGGLAVV